MTSEVTLREHGPPVSVPLTTSAGRALAATGILAVAAPDPSRDGHWRLRAAHRVGAVRVPGGPVVRVLPKLPIGRLFFLLGFSLDPARAWRNPREGRVEVGSHDGVVPALAHAVERQLAAALLHGVRRGYREVASTSLTVRGRLDVAAQLRRHHGHTPPVEIVHDDWTVDTAENRILRTAVDRLLCLPGVPQSVRGRLLRHARALAEAEPLPRGTAPPSWQPSRLNAGYQPALRLAEVVIHGSSPEHRPGDARTLAVDGFLIDMNRLFEDFVAVALRECLAERGHVAHLQEVLHLDTDRRVRLRPDLVVRAAVGRRPVAVVDAKYKTEKADGLLNGDLYQALAYATVLGLSDAHLVYAAGRETHRSHEVRGTAGIRIHQHSLDLAADPELILRAVRGIAARLDGTTPASRS